MLDVLHSTSALLLLHLVLGSLLAHVSETAGTSAAPALRFQTSAAVPDLSYKERASSRQLLQLAPLCPSTYFNHFVGATVVSPGLWFNPKDPGSTGPACVPRYSQLPAPAGARFALNESVFGPDMPSSITASSSITVVECIESCPSDVCCIVQYEQAGSDASSSTDNVCKHAYLPIAGPVQANGDSTPRFYYKLPTTDGDVLQRRSSAPAASITEESASIQSTPLAVAAAAEGSTAAGNSGAGDSNSSNGSSNRRNLKTIAATVYARCSMEAWGDFPATGHIGTSPNPALVEQAKTTVEWNAVGCTSEATCQATCNANAACWGFIYVPQLGYAIRGGEDWIGVRSFFLVPDVDVTQYTQVGCPPQSLYQPNSPECRNYPSIRTCCAATCANAALTIPPKQYTCSRGILNSNALNSTTLNPSDNVCCVPTCGDTVLTSEAPLPFQGCGFPSAYNPDSKYKFPPNNINCCDAAALASTDVVLQGAQPVTVMVSQTFVLQLTVKVLSLDQNPARNVVLYHDVPSRGALIFAGVPTSFRCSLLTASRVFCELGDLAPDATVTLSFNVRARAAGEYNSLSTVDAVGDMELSNNRASSPITVLGACCDGKAGRCTQAATAAACTTGTFIPDEPCSASVCPPPTKNPTCGNTKPGADPPIQYACPGGMVFNRKSLGTSPPSIDNCCSSTCTNIDTTGADPRPFSCPTGWTLNRGNALSTNPSLATCCVRGIEPQFLPDVAISSMLQQASSQLAVGEQFVIQSKVVVLDGLNGIQNVYVTQTVPAGLDILSVTVSFGACSQTGQEVNCDLGFLRFNQTVFVSVAVVATRAGSYFLPARVRGENDKDPLNNRATLRVNVLGACCSATYTSRLRTQQACDRVKGKFYATKSLTNINCQAPSGACCKPDGECNIEAEAACTAAQGKWQRGGSCSKKFCPAPSGACCSRSTGTCSVMTRALCMGTWREGQQCTQAFCPAQCVRFFQACQPGISTCCLGATCQKVPSAFPGVGDSYACQPIQPTCSGQGEVCGGCNGGTCCPGLICKFDCATRQGTCQQPGPVCSQEGYMCSKDDDCCRGMRCSTGRCRVPECTRVCKTPACEADRKLDCCYRTYALVSSRAESL